MWRTAKLRETDQLDERLEHSAIRTPQDAGWHECLTASPCADQHLLRVRTYDLDQSHGAPRDIRRALRTLDADFCGLLSAFRVTDVNSPLQALERVSVGDLKKLTWYMDIIT